MPKGREHDALARQRAVRTLSRTAEAAVGVEVEVEVEVDDGPLRDRLHELDVISPYAFTPGRRWPRPGRR